MPPGSHLHTLPVASAVYVTSKTGGERALWRFMEEQRPHFVANTILPNVNLGRILASPGVTGAAVPQVVQGQIPSNIGPRESRAYRFLHPLTCETSLFSATDLFSFTQNT